MSDFNAWQRGELQRQQQLAREQREAQALIQHGHATSYAADRQQYEADQRAAFYERLRHDEEAKRRAADGEARAIEQWRENRHDREVSNARAERAEQRAIEQWEISQANQRRQEARALEAHDWHRESHTLQMQREQERLARERNAERLARARFTDPTPSGVLGNAQFATRADCRDMGLCDSAGFFLGVLDGEGQPGLFYNGDKHLTIYAGTGSGKGVNYVLPNLALYGRPGPNRPGRSVVVTDVKGGENAFASAHHRAFNLESRVVCLNPAGLYGLDSVCINPFDVVINAPQAEMFDRAAGPASVLAPVLDREAQNAWVNEGAALLLRAVIAHLAATDPERCTPGRLWEFFITATKALFKKLEELQDSPLTAVRGYAVQFMDWMKSPNQWNAYSSAIGYALQGFTPDSPYTRATDRTTFDARTITQTPTTVYLMMPKGDLLDKGHWVSLMLNHLVRVTGEGQGPCGALFLLDEFTQLPPVPRILEAVNMNRSAGQQFVVLAQDRETLERRYGKSGAGQFERQSGMVAAWDLRDISLMKDLEYLSGRTSVQIIGASMSEGGQIGTGLTLSEQTRPLLQPEDMRTSPAGTQYLLPHRGRMVRARLMPWYAIEDVEDVLRDTRKAKPDVRLPRLDRWPERVLCG